MAQLISLKNNQSTINTIRHLYSEVLLPRFVPSDEKLKQFIDEKDPTDDEITRRERHLQKVNGVLSNLTVVVQDAMVMGNLTGLLTDEFGDIGKRIRTIRELESKSKLRTQIIWIPFPLSVDEYESICDKACPNAQIYICDKNLKFDSTEELEIGWDCDIVDSIVTILPVGTKLGKPESGQKCVITAVPPKNFYNFAGEYIVFKKFNDAGDVIIEGKGKRNKNIGKCAIAPRDVMIGIGNLIGRSHNTKIINLSGDKTLLELFGYNNIL